MTVGVQSSSATIDAELTTLATALRDICVRIKNLNTKINGQGNGQQALVNLGYSTAPDPVNPGGISDAAWALQAIAYLNTQAGVYYGQVQQGGTGGTGAAQFNFDNALSPLWAGQ